MKYFLKTGFIDLDVTFNCGQCFRWERQDDDSYAGFAGGKEASVTQGAGGITLSGVAETDLPFWEDYFCADMDYPSIVERLSQDSTLKAACDFAPGLRVLRQEPFETLISFIISQNNHIKRITGIINRLCQSHGREGAFPSPRALCHLKAGDLTALGAGYRADYIIDAAKKVAKGEIILDELTKMPYNSAREELLKIKGVGGKVADCVLLFGFHKLDAFPRDVWIKRALAEHYPDGLPKCITGYEGIAQQFLLHYIRNRTQLQRAQIVQIGD